MLVAVLPLADRLAVPLVALAPGAGEVNTVAVEAMLWRPLAKASVTLEAALAFEVSSLPSCHLPRCSRAESLVNASGCVSLASKFA